MLTHRPRTKSSAAPTAATVETRADAVARLLGDRPCQGLPELVSDPVVVATLVKALENGNGAGRKGRKPRRAT